VAFNPQQKVRVAFKSPAAGAAGSAGADALLLESELEMVYCVGDRYSVYLRY
jgi:hypothetical protein